MAQDYWQGHVMGGTNCQNTSPWFWQNLTKICSWCNPQSELSFGLEFGDLIKRKMGWIGESIESVKSMKIRDSLSQFITLGLSPSLAPSVVVVDRSLMLASVKFDNLQTVFVDLAAWCVNPHRILHKIIDSIAEIFSYTIFLVHNSRCIRCLIPRGACLVCTVFMQAWLSHRHW